MGGSVSRSSVVLYREGPSPQSELFWLVNAKLDEGKGDLRITSGGGDREWSLVVRGADLPGLVAALGHRGPIWEIFHVGLPWLGRRALRCLRYGLNQSVGP